MDRITFRLTMDTGFFSMVFHLCTAYLEHGPNILVDSSRWGYGPWHTFFRSLREGRSIHTLTIRTMHPNYEKWSLGSYRQILRKILIPTEILRERIQAMLYKIDCPYTAIFVRRGDKIVSGEARYIPMSEILSHVTYNENTVFFVQTDDYTVVEELKTLLPTHTIHSTVPPTKRGSFHHEKYKQVVGTPWMSKSPEEAKEETLEMLAGLFVCLNAEQCWTDDTSNVGRFLKLYDDRVHVYPEDYSINEFFCTHPAWSLRS